MILKNCEKLIFIEYLTDNYLIFNVLFLTYTNVHYLNLKNGQKKKKRKVITLIYQ